MSKSLVSGRAFLEGPRWHDGVLYVSDMHGDAVLSVEGGQVTRTIDTPDRHAIACEVGGADGRTLFMLTATTLGDRAESQQALTAAIEIAGI